MKDQLFILLQHLVPQHALSRLVGWFANTDIVWIKRLFIRQFARHFDVNMSEAAEPDLDAYPNFNAFFTRALTADARPLAPGEDTLLCPADGFISQLGGAAKTKSLLAAQGPALQLRSPAGRR